MGIWQDCLVALALLVAGIYVVWRLHRVGKRDTPPACGSCQCCPSATEGSCEESMPPPYGISSEPKDDSSAA